MPSQQFNPNQTFSRLDEIRKLERSNLRHENQENNQNEKCKCKGKYKLNAKTNKYNHVCIVDFSKLSKRDLFPKSKSVASKMKSENKETHNQYAHRKDYNNSIRSNSGHLKRTYKIENSEKSNHLHKLNKEKFTNINMSIDISLIDKGIKGKTGQKRILKDPFFGLKTKNFDSYTIKVIADICKVAKENANLKQLLK